MIGVKSEEAGLGRMRYQGVIRSLVTKKLEEIRTIEKNIKESKLTVSIKYLLQNRNRENTTPYNISWSRGDAEMDEDGENEAANIFVLMCWSIAVRRDCKST